MRTEREIIYSIWETVRGGEMNADDPINERLLRAYLSSHRGKVLYKELWEGRSVPDECFQPIALKRTYSSLIINQSNFVTHEEVQNSFRNIGNVLVYENLPKIIYFKHNEGLRANIDGYQIPILHSEEWLNSQKTRFGKFHPSIKHENNKLFLYEGSQCGTENPFSDLNIAVNKIKESKRLSGFVHIDLYGVLVNPDDGLDYDFANSPYPMPDHLVDLVISSVNRNNFQVFLNMRSDETADRRDNTKEQRSNEEF